MIVVLGSSGYVGSEFARYFETNGIDFQSVSRTQVDYTHRDTLIRFLREVKPDFLINTAGYTGKPNVDACEIFKADCLAGNAVLPGVIREACEATATTWGHVSSGCIYTGCRSDGGGFRETDPPNFCFRSGYCSFYSGSKALGEEILSGAIDCYIWRLRIPFDHHDSPRNYLSKVMRYNMLLDATNSISHLGEFANAAYRCWEKRVEPGIYHVTNPGRVTTRQVVELIKQTRHLDKTFRFFEDEEHFMRTAAKTPRSNCVLDSSKLLATGIELTPVTDAIERSLRAWQPMAMDEVRSPGPPS